ncbi:uncharacterized protein LOC130893760 [Diorhabda carinulata]|uniref:uncharacterized protein LOC130893760 n=1 Tax=Diorhabda carinulata TaxID=1163345 RepID=UPI00259FEE0C|nr:uncharacterized protein LOC130893760 [Diorhabda carinulata]
MGIKIIFFSVFAFLLIENCSSISPTILNYALNYIISKIKGANITIPNVLITIPDPFQDVIVGYINLTNLHIYGLDTLDAKANVDGLTTDREGFNKNNITVIGIFDNIGINTDYNLDMGILDLIPLYGAGTLNLGFKKFDFNVNTILYDYLTLHNASLVNLDVGFAFRDSNKVSITGFWKNEEVSSFLTELFKLLEITFCMWYNYYKACIDCIFSNILEIILNLFLNADAESGIACDCFEEVTFLQNLNIKNLTLAWMIGDYEYMKEEITTNQAFKQLYEEISNIIAVIIKENNLKV